MSDENTLRARIAELEAHVALLEERWRLNDEVDGLAEIALRDRLPLDHALRTLMPALARATAGRLVFVRTYDETLSLHDYVHAEDEDASLPFDAESIVHDVGASEDDYVHRMVGPSTLVAQRIDVAGEHFGTAAVLVPETLDRHAIDRVAQLLDTWCEEIDNHLAAIADARKKAILTREISDALKDPVLDRGIDQAIGVLRENVPFEVLLLVFRHEDEGLGDTLRFKLIRAPHAEGGEVAVDHAADDEVLKARAYRIMDGDDTDLRELLGVQRYREELLITGARSTKVVGRLLVASRRGEFNTFDRDLLERFADSLRQRIVDFNREWKNLKTTFSRPVVDKLLAVEGYQRKLLTPREKMCAVMFADISGFTRLSEQILVRPEKIGRFIDLWSEQAVDAVWDTGGVFDKMVGDCVIAIWGPPFFDVSPKDACLAATEAAMRVREHTRALVGHSDFPELAQMPGLDVAIGLHFCPLFVGTFGPDQDYTGFSAGMNNTARLQGQAKGGEILCMDAFVDVLGLSDRFGEERQAAVKNVAEPLRFRAWKG
ncbi:MAG: adenylate/guanylate cyclase domain-containing protein [Sandaracinaceae bacterium]|nr:adenylate/guanylate cyclase domain-containing protein [Sandaracinaceae bacterium]